MVVVVHLSRLRGFGFFLLLSSFMIFKYISIDFTAKLAALLQVVLFFFNVRAREE